MEQKLGTKPENFQPLFNQKQAREINSPVKPIGDFKPMPLKGLFSGNVVEHNKPSMAQQLQSQLQVSAVPVISEKDLLEARGKGFEEGYAKGYSAAKSTEAETEKHIQASLNDAILKINNIFDAVQKQEVNHVRELSNLVAAIARKVAGQALQADPFLEIEQVINKSIPVFFDEPKIAIYVHSSLVQPLKGRMQTIIKNTGIKNNIEILANDSLSFGSCDIQWRSGGIKIDKENMWKRIEELVAGC